VINKQLKNSHFLDLLILTSVVGPMFSATQIQNHFSISIIIKVNFIARIKCVAASQAGITTQITLRELQKACFRGGVDLSVQVEASLPEINPNKYLSAKTTVGKDDLYQSH
jgi:hypothetical protein